MSYVQSRQHPSFSTFAAPLSRSVRPSQALRSSSPPSSMRSFPLSQPSREYPAHGGHSFERISIFPPSAGNASEHTRPAAFNAPIQRLSSTSSTPSTFSESASVVSTEPEMHPERTIPLGHSFARLPVSPLAKVNHTGLPGPLKADVETLSGLSLDDVQVHYNSSQPAQLQALAYTQATEIHVGPGQERHLPHEVWHVVQQKQGRVQPTLQMRGVHLNNDAALEMEAEHMGAILDHDAHRGSKMLKQDSPGNRTVTGRNGGVDHPIQMVQVTTIKNEPGFYATEAEQGFRTAARLTSKVATEPTAAIGYGANDKLTGKPLTTSIKWTPIDATVGEGTAVKAERLGPDHPLGSPPGGDFRALWNKRTTAFNSTFKGDFKAGHLLNEQLGGSGIDGRNLTCISASANTNMHDKVERVLQQIVNDRHHWVHYEVVVNYAKLNQPAFYPGYTHIKFDYYAHQMRFSWGPIDADGQPTGNTSTWTMDIPHPEPNKSPAATGPANTTQTPTNNAMPQAQTELAWDEIVLTKWDDVRKRIEALEVVGPVIHGLVQHIDQNNKEIADREIERQKSIALLNEQRNEIELLKAELQKVQQKLQEEREQRGRLTEMLDREHQARLEAERELERARETLAELEVETDKRRKVGEPQ